MPIYQALAQANEETHDGEHVTTTAARFRTEEDKVRYLRTVVEEARATASIRSRARDIVFRIAGCAPRDARAHAIALAAWVQREIKYVNELPEVLQTPETTIAEGYGDCDDHVALLASLLESVGIPAHLFAIGWSPSPPAPKLEHIYVVAQLPDGTYLPLDTTFTTRVDRKQRDPLAELRARGIEPRLFVA